MSRALVTAMTLLLFQSNAVAARAPTCIAGSFLTHRSPLEGAPGFVGDSQTTDLIALIPTEDKAGLLGALIQGGCTNEPTKVRAWQTKKKGTRIIVKWESCAGLKKVKLKLRIEPSCDSLTGSLSAKGFKARSFSGSALPVCENPPSADVEAAVAAAASPVENVWGSPADFARFVLGVEHALGCSVREPAAQSLESKATQSLASRGYEGNVQYCGPGTSEDEGLVGSTVGLLARGCINENCYEHDQCYGDVCSAADVCSFAANIFPEADDCDAELFASCLEGGRCRSRPAPLGGGLVYEDLTTQIVCNYVALRKSLPVSGCGEPPCGGNRCTEGSCQDCFSNSECLVGQCGYDGHCNRPPTIGSFSCDSNGADVLLNASYSDPDGDAASYSVSFSNGVLAGTAVAGPVGSGSSGSIAPAPWRTECAFACCVDTSWSFSLVVRDSSGSESSPVPCNTCTAYTPRCPNDPPGC